MRSLKAVNVKGPIDFMPEVWATKAVPHIKATIISKKLDNLFPINYFFSANHFSASKAAMQPIPAAVTACR